VVGQHPGQHLVVVLLRRGLRERWEQPEEVSTFDVLAGRGVQLRFIQPGEPVQNAFAERFVG